MGPGWGWEGQAWLPPKAKFWRRPEPVPRPAGCKCPPAQEPVPEARARWDNVGNQLWFLCRSQSGQTRSRLVLTEMGRDF